jgi:hypothetical protein
MTLSVYVDVYVFVSQSIKKYNFCRNCLSITTLSLKKVIILLYWQYNFV